MPIQVPPRKGLKAKALAEQRPDLSVSEVARLAGLDRGAAANAISKRQFGRDKPKSRA